MNPDVTEGGRMINWASRWAVVAGLAGAAMLAGAVVPREAGAWTAPVALQARQGATPGVQEGPGRTVFQGATVIDGTGAPAREEMAIVVDGERIEAIVPVAELTDELLEGAELVDASSWFAIPRPGRVAHARCDHGQPRASGVHPQPVPVRRDHHGA